MRLRLRWLPALLLFTCAVAAQATVTVFGPADYVVASGAPQTFTPTFAADLHETCGGRAAYFVAVSNADGGVSSATVSVNGTTLLSDHDFPLRSLREFAIDPTASNSLSVTLKGGRPGSALRVAVERRIESPVAGPKSFVIAHATLTDSTTFNVINPSAVYTLVVHATGAANASIAINGVSAVTPADFAGATRSIARQVKLAAGTNQVVTSVNGAPTDTLGWTIQQQFDESICAPQVTIDSPADGDTITTRRILVSGTASGSLDLGVIVNGIPAQFDLLAAGTADDPFRWSVTLDPPAGDVTITATVSAPSGGSASATRTVHYQPATEAVLLSAAPSSGILPFNTTVSLSSTIRNAVKYELDLDGDGVYETVQATSPDPQPVAFSTTGARTLHARVTTADGHIFTGTANVIVQDFTAADRVVRASWTRLMSSMAANDANGAIAQMAGPDAQAKYTDILQAMASAGLLIGYPPSIQDLRAVWIHGNAAHYLLLRNEPDGTYGYHVYFVCGADGVWRIIQF
jgi:hypothetical protein